MILHHVAQRTRMVVIAPPMFDPHLFSGGDGHILYVSPVPERLEEWIGKAERQNVLHRFLAQIMVDAEDLGLIESVRQPGVQGSGGF